MTKTIHKREKKREKKRERERERKREKSLNLKFEVFKKEKKLSFSDKKELKKNLLSQRFR